MGFFENILTKNYKKEINNYINFLKNQGDDFISTFLAEAILFRVDLENEGTLPSTKLQDGSICPELIGLVPLWSSLEECIKTLKKNNEKTSYMVLNLWYFTVLSLIKPDLLNEGKDMWNELSRGLKNANIELKRIINKRYHNDPSSRMRAFKILNILPPEALSSGR